MLENILWKAFTGTHAHLTVGTDRIRRYAPGYSPLMGFADPADPPFAELAPHCSPGERIYCAEWRGPEPKGWKIDVDTTMCAMAWQGNDPATDETLGAIRLASEHVPQMLALTELTRPGPFGPRTIELGEWYGVFEGAQLIAMAGERLKAGNLHEISGVCTLPQFQGRGLARRLTLHVLRQQLARGDQPFLHVASANTRARELYRKMGFAEVREVPMRIVVVG
ncbi:GNAT family N-acetyltransferase [Usitatibacter palustris]|uniref:N-acetyltransferase domain-containing protein n=1 Tax=Usitatibacter palustris TaxID=2732487 RepID=A0A6M4HF54_9PROT|nr:GNAT family N-acetyltransferase [Usitatibacter palustris]QJR16677.1 hypothetical protein DSM104440_03513 [Usitatibacter palustris]